MTARPEATPDGDVYEVFARIEKKDSLHHVGSVIASTPDLAKMYAYTLYNEWHWDEMIAVPRHAIRTVIQAD